MTTNLPDRQCEEEATTKKLTTKFTMILPMQMDMITSLTLALVRVAL
jgi:hypothetical protein